MTNTSPRGRLSRLVAVCAAALIAVAGVATATPALASTGDTLTPVTSTAAPAPVDYRDQLIALQGTQTPAEIASIASSGGHTEVLLDVSTGQIVAALKPTTTTISPFALSPVGPGCTTVSLCMTTTSSVPYGYTGSGSLSGTWSSIIRVTPGNATGSFTWNGLVNTFAAYTVVNLTSAVTVTRIARA